jgi:aarF domain-containing kinase
MDNAKMRSICHQWGIDDVNIFASATLQRPYNPNKAVHLTGTLTAEDIYRMQMVTKDRVSKFLSDTSKIPKELIFVGRTLNLIRSNNKHFGSPVNRVNIMVMWAIRGLGKSGAVWADGRDSTSMLQTWFISPLHMLQFRIHLAAISTAFYFSKLMEWVQKIMGWQRITFEDQLDKQMIQGLRDKFGIVVNESNFMA